MRAGLIVFVGLLAVAYCLPQPQQPHGGGAPQGFFQYANVPAHKEYEFGWNRGNEHHYISRFEQSKDHRFRTRVKWGDKDGYGEHYWEYNHGPKKDEYKEPEYHAPAPAYHAPAPSYSPPKKGYGSENIEKVVVAPEGFQRIPDRYEVVEPKHKEPEYHAPAPSYSPPKKGYGSENIEKVVVAPEEFQRIPDRYEVVEPAQDRYASENIAQIAAAPERYHQGNPNGYHTAPNGYGSVDFGQAG